MTVNYNMKVEIERVNGVWVTQVEMANYGRARRITVRLEDLGEALKQVAEFHDENLTEMENFLIGSQPDNLPAQPPAAPPLDTDRDPNTMTAAEIEAQNAAAIKAVEEAAALKAGKPVKPGKSKVSGAPKAKVRQFAAPPVTA